MDIMLIAILLVVAILLSIIAFFKKQLVILLFSSIIFIFLGVGMFGGVSQQVTVILQNNSVTTVSFASNVVNDSFSTGISFLFVLIGLFMLIISALSFFDPKSSMIGDSNDDE